MASLDCCCSEAQAIISKGKEFTLDKQLLTARLQQKLLLSDPAQCYHLEFAIDELSHFDFLPGQFISCVAVDPRGKTQTRAYSIASAPSANMLDLCVNRVEDGFFSNFLCDLEIGQIIQFHGPHGFFTLRQPLTDGVLIATGTGIAPIVGFVQYLFPENGEDRSEGRQFWLVYGTRHESGIYYRKYFEKVASERRNFHYLPSLSRPHEGWEGLRGYVQEHVAEILTRRESENHSGPISTVAEGAGFDIHAYICGLNNMVSGNRDRLKERGWHRKQIIFERYD
jgi:ferredoxin-NADP reductase